MTNSVTNDCRYGYADSLTVFPAGYRSGVITHNPIRTALDLQAPTEPDAVLQPRWSPSLPFASAMRKPPEELTLPRSVAHPGFLLLTR